MAPLHMLLELLFADEFAPALLERTHQGSTNRPTSRLILVLHPIHAQLLAAKFEHGLRLGRLTDCLLGFDDIGRLARRINQLGVCAFLLFYHFSF